MKSKGNVLILNENTRINAANMSLSTATATVVPASTATMLVAPPQSTNNSDVKQSSSSTTTTATQSSSTISDFIPDELIFSLMMLIVEGRSPDCDSNKGYKEGTHINMKKSNHQCLVKTKECHIPYQVKTKLKKCIEDNIISTNKASVCSVLTPLVVSTVPVNNNQTNSSSTSINKTVESQQQQQPQIGLKSPAVLAAINTTKRTQSLSPSPSPSRSSSSSSLNNSNNNSSSNIGSVLISPINIIIDVCHVADCCYDVIKGGLINSKNAVSYELLERWNISIMPNKRSDNKLTFNELFQAIRSYLHFSQISSWLNQNKGQSPKTVAYSIHYFTQDNTATTINRSLNEFKNVLSATTATTPTPTTSEVAAADACESECIIDEEELKKSFDLQTFPSINIICGTNHLYNLTVNLQARKRKNSLIPPYIYCNGLNKCCKFNKSTRQRLSISEKNSSSKNTDDDTIMMMMPTPSLMPESILNVKRRSSMELHDNNIDMKPFYQKQHQQPQHLLATPLSPLPGERRRLSIDTLSEFDTKLPQSKFLKCNSTTSPHDKKQEQTAGEKLSTNGEDDSGINSNTSSSSHSSRSIYSNNDSFSKTINLPQKQVKIPARLDFNNNASTANEPSTSFASNYTSPPASSNKAPLVSYSPSSPIIVLSNLADIFGKSSNSTEFFRNYSNNENSKVLTELCTSTQNQLNLVDDNNDESSTKIIPLTTSTPLTCNTVLSPTTNNDHLVNPTTAAAATTKGTATFFYLNDEDESSKNGRVVEDDDEDEDDLCIKKKTNGSKETRSSNDDETTSLTPLTKEQIVHFIRSPTDGVCLPIFNNSTNDEDNNDDPNSVASLNDNLVKRNQRCIKNIFHNRSGLPLSSSPAPMRKTGSAFTFDKSLRNPKSIKNALSLSLLKTNVDDEEDEQNKQFYFNSRTFTQATSCRLLGTFEESLLNGRMNPMGIVEGFYAQIGASGSFFPEHATLPVHAAFYQICDDIAASPYLGVINLSALGRRGYKVPNKGTIQVTLFNPNNTVVKMFVVMYDLSDMPPNHRTFLRQRTMYVPLPSLSCADENNNTNDCAMTELKSYLRYSIHLRFATSKSGKLYLHTNVKLIFARNKCEIDPRLAKYEYKTFTEAPKAPKYSSRK